MENRSIAHAVHPASEGRPVQSKPVRSRARALRRAWSYPLRSRTAAQPAANMALMEEPSKAARTRLPQKIASIFNVTLVFIGHRFSVARVYVLLA